MKITPISFSQPVLSNYKVKQFNNNNVTSPIYSGFPSQNILSNYNLINFCGSGETDINEDYFKLPQGAIPDEYQKEAARSLQKGDSVLVSAPTGTGKTAIAQYIMFKNLEENKKTFYTTPLKALSNQKLLEFRKIYGDENVGILTGDRRENANAPIVVMTTEVYRNMAFDKFFNNRESLADNVKTIIFDEFHYLGDPDRGASWEEAIIFTPKNTQILGLSATIGNDKQLSDWLETNGRKNLKLVHVPSENRHVPLSFYTYYPLKSNLEAVNKDELRKTLPQNSEAHSISVRRKAKNYEQKLPYVSDYISLVDSLAEVDKLPAILFVFNKKFGANLLEAFGERGSDLTSDGEKEEISNIVKEYETKYGYLGDEINKDALLKGYAVHNAGILPVQKELVEELFNKKLLKTVIATETLAAGINMPARTVVIATSDKPTSDPKSQTGRRRLTANEFHQMSGRAGRRGIDKLGNVVTMCVNPNVEDAFKTLIASDPNPVYSVFNPDYPLIVNYHKYLKEPDKIKDIFADSFKVYSSGEGNSSKKINAMFNKYESKSNLLKDEGFMTIDANRDKSLTSKGELIPNIVGYPQIPVINLITSHAFSNLSAEDLVFFAASIVGGQYRSTSNTENDEDLFRYDNSPSAILRSNYERLTHLSSTFNLSNLDKLMSRYKLLNDNYNRELLKYSIDDEPSQVPNYQVGSWIYLFAYLNKMNPDNTIANWQKLNSLIDSYGAIRDEGGYYNAVNQTIDLLSQMIDVCKATKTVYEYKDDYYYDETVMKLKKAIRLLKQEPMQNYIYEN